MWTIITECYWCLVNDGCGEKADITLNVNKQTLFSGFLTVIKVRRREAECHNVYRVTWGDLWTHWRQSWHYYDLQTFSTEKIKWSAHTPVTRSRGFIVARPEATITIRFYWLDNSANDSNEKMGMTKLHAVTALTKQIIWEVLLSKGLNDL